MRCSFKGLFLISFGFFVTSFLSTESLFALPQGDYNPNDLRNEIGTSTDVSSEPVLSEGAFTDSADATSTTVLASYAQNEVGVRRGFRQQALPESLAKSILTRVLLPARENLLAGQPITLQESISHRSDQIGRAEIVHAYWNLTACLADFQFAVEELETLNQIQRPGGAGMNDATALLDSEITSAEARVVEAKLIALDSQEKLQTLIGIASDQTPPLPADLPWVGQYITNYDLYASAGQGTPVQKRIDRVLPVMWQLVDRRAAAVESAAIAFDELSQTYRAGSLPVSELLNMHRRMRDQRIAFLAAVRDYNNSIADYAMTTSTAQREPSHVVAMLIDKPSDSELHPVDSDALRQADLRNQISPINPVNRSSYDQPVERSSAVDSAANLSSRNYRTFMEGEQNRLPTQRIPLNPSSFRNESSSETDASAMPSTNPSAGSLKFR